MFQGLKENVLFFFKFIYFERGRERARVCMSEWGRGRDGERKSPTKSLRGQCTEPHMGLEPMKL